MQELTKRQEKILTALIDDYIKTAEPVSSKSLSKKRGFDVSAATIRNEFQELTEGGYITQPHTSSGRRPTAKAYRFFVDNISPIQKDDFFKGFDMSDELKFIEQISRNIAFETSNLVLTYLPERDFVFKEGWEELLQMPEFQEKSFLNRFIDEVSYIEKNMKDLVKSTSSEIEIYIGRENPLLRSEGFSLMITRSNFPNNEKGLVAMLGPERTEYERNISILKSLIKSLEDF